MIGRRPILLGLACLPLAAQSPVFQSDARIVEVAIVAKDANDAPVGDLRKADFRVFDNRVEQTIQSFEQPGMTRRSASVADQKATPPGRRTPRRSIIVLDMLNSDLASRVRARQAIFQMLRTIPSDVDSIAVFALGAQLHLLHDFSANTALLREVVESYQGENPATNASPGDPFAGGFSLTGPTRATTTPAGEPDLYGDIRLARTLEAFTEIARSMRDVPGEKNLIWLTGGFPLPEDPRDIVAATRELAASRITMYPVDSRGLIGCIGACPAEVNGNIASMKEIAGDTGGHAFHDSNDIAGQAREALDDSRENYILTYAPSNYRQDGSVHEVSLRMKRKGIDLRYRPSYIAD